MLKIKPSRTADCVVAGFRWHKNGRDTLVGSLLLGLYDGTHRLHHVGVTSAVTMDTRRPLRRARGARAVAREQSERRPSAAEGGGGRRGGNPPRGDIPGASGPTRANRARAC